MQAQAVAKVIRDLDYFPGWAFHPQPITSGRVWVDVAYPSWETTPGRNYHRPDTFLTTFPISSDEMKDEDDVIYAILKMIAQINEHESREALRAQSRGMFAPYHPHRWDGKALWNSHASG